MNNNKYCVIMAGGIGSRFWPISRTAQPKQFLDILGTGKTFIRSTFERFTPIIPVENFLVVTNSAYKGLVLEQIPELNENQVLCEPFGRNTAPCIAYAAMRVAAIDPNAEMIVTPADHLVQNEPEFHKVIKEALEFINGKDIMMTIGLRPTRPATGYGYIQVSKNADEVCCINKVKTFTEKPNLEMAKVFVDSGEFFWNSGIFIWSVKTIIKAIGKYLPDTYQLFESIAPYYNTPDEAKHIEIIYPECRSISIDFGVMEKADNVYVRCSDFGWSDIGTWGSLYEYAEKDTNGNVTSDNVMIYDTQNCIIKVPESKMAVIEGLKDYIVVANDDLVMICPIEHEQNIKKFIDDIKFTKGDKFI